MANQVEPGHIMLVGPAYPYRGGIAHFLDATGTALEKRGHTVSIVTFSRQYPEILFPGKSQYETGVPDTEHKSVRLIDSINPLSWFQAARRMLREKPDAVVFNYWLPFFAPSYGLIAKRIKRRDIPVIGLVHNALPHERRPGDRILSTFFLSTCDGLLIMSDSVKRDIDDLGITARHHVTGHPVYASFGEPIEKTEARKALGLPLEGPVALFFGFIRPYKGLHVLLESMPDVVKSLASITLLVAGECYGDLSVYTSKVTEYGLDEHVHFHTDYIPGDKVKLYFCAADLVVQPYTSATQSGVAQIAYHFERPMIVTNVGGLAETVPHERAGLVIPPEDAGALASAIIRFFDENMFDTLARGVKNQKHRHSWERLCEAIEDLAHVHHSK